MDYIISGGKVIISRVPDFKPELIFECGQCFRWVRLPDGSWEGVAKGRVLSIAEAGDQIEFNCGEDEFLNIWYQYFDLGRDYEVLRKRISTDPFTSKAAEYGTGIRILNQEPWEALCTFILSQCNNIARIKGLVERLCRMFGEKTVYNGKEYSLFPSAERLAQLNDGDLDPLRAGYRAAYILSAARAVAGGTLDLGELQKRPTEDVLRSLTALQGVGVKVASCAALFGFGKTDAFPVDVWMRRAIESHYGGKRFDSTVFGEDAGIAQQYIFHYIRSLKGNTNEGCCD